MPEITPEMQREIDTYLAGDSPHGVGDVGDLYAWLAAQRAEIVALRQERDDHVKGYDGASRKWARERDLRAALEAERDALLRVARIAASVEIIGDEITHFYDLTDALAAPEVQALLGVDSPSGAPHPPDRP